MLNRAINISNHKNQNKLKNFKQITSTKGDLLKIQITINTFIETQACFYSTKKLERKFQ